MLRSLGHIAGLTGALLVPAMASAAAMPPALEKAFAGTIVSTYPDGRKAELWLHPDGTYTSEGRRHDRHSGRWSLKGDKVCFRRLIFTYCLAIPSGTEFNAKAVTGEPIHVRLEPGREGLKRGGATAG
jgi:hypothetical protein